MSEQSSDPTATIEVHTAATHQAAEDAESDPEESEMAQESPTNTAAEIPVTNSGEVDDSNEHFYNQDLKHPAATGFSLSETHITSGNYGGTRGVVMKAGPCKGSSSQPTSPVISPSSAAASRLAEQDSDFILPTVQLGALKGDNKSGAVVVAEDSKNPAMEKLEFVRKWSINTYKTFEQHVIPPSVSIHEEFGYNSETQKLLAKNGETLLGAINFFITSVSTLVTKTIEDTLQTVKQYENARIEYDAYRTDLEELNLGPRDANTVPKIELSQQLFQMHKEKYDTMRANVSVKLKFLEENKIKVLHNQLVLFHNAVAAYFAGNQKQLEQTLKQFHIKLKTPGADAPSWLEEQ
ncbi:arfaptin-1 isoform X3 [Latimeria chalumnae]|uniref:arfaptin-1 isoform X3 n=1 Tax=Latimeria chalumnae TaxID=7897 RepID=UPI00313BAA66